LHTCVERDAEQPDDTPDDLLTSTINDTGLKQNLRCAARPFSLPDAAEIHILYMQSADRQLGSSAKCGFSRIGGSVDQ